MVTHRATTRAPFAWLASPAILGMTTIPPTSPPAKPPSPASSQAAAPSSRSNAMGAGPPFAAAPLLPRYVRRMPTCAQGSCPTVRTGHRRALPEARPHVCGYRFRPQDDRFACAAGSVWRAPASPNPPVVLLLAAADRRGGVMATLHHAGWLLSLSSRWAH